MLKTNGWGISDTLQKAFRGNRVAGWEKPRLSPGPIVGWMIATFCAKRKRKSSAGGLRIQR